MAVPRRPVRHRDLDAPQRALRPQAGIRDASLLLRPYNPAQDLDVFGAVAIADLGDLRDQQGDAERAAGTDRGAARARDPRGRGAP